MDHRVNIFIFLWTSLYSKVLSIQYTPVEVGDLTDCALILPNIDQYTSNLLQSDFGGPVNCITYDAINQAYLDARKRIDIPHVEDDWKSEDVAAVGQLILDISQQISREFNLNQEDLEVGLPQINTMKTAIRDICPVYLSSISCRAGKYRRHDGLCNNVNHPTWGATMTAFSRILPPHFVDHISVPRISISGKPLPPARTVSKTIHTDEGYHDHAGTVMLVAWGQFMDHDFTLMGTPLDSQNRNEPEECCNRPEHLKNPYCMEITIPEDDYFYKKFNVKCQDFVRAFPGVQPNCKLGSRNPFNTLTSVIDGNTVYGVTESFSRQLRAGYGGFLKMNPAFSQFGLKELLPMKTEIPDEGCVRTNTSQFCFLAGEIRVNEQLVLTCIHTLMAREHNRIAKELAAINPHWDDEILYQEARRITVAEIQHVTFNEFLPLILGKEIMEKYELIINSEGYWDGYDPDTNPGILDAFSAAAFRFGHSLLPSAIERWSKIHKFIASKRLSELIRRPYDLYRAGVLDEYFMGLLNQVAQAMDDSVTQEVTNNLLKKPGNRFGLDLVSFNIQRGRDFGLPSYMYFRRYCGLRTADTFTDMYGSMPNSTIHRYMTIYETPWDIDLWSGGVSEKPLPGSMVGPTFACIIATQMSLIKRGDRFWYELPNQPSSFSPEQLREIKKVKLSRILCDNTDLIDTVQIYAMVLPDHDINPRVPCRSSVLPKLDLSPWIDIPTKSFIDKTENQTTTFNNRNSIANYTAAPSAYEYHIKTVAIIEGNPLINVNELINSNSDPELSKNSDHKILKRSINSTENLLNQNFTKKSNELSTSSSTIHKNFTISNSTNKDVTKRHSYIPGQKYKKNKPQMTQAIMKEDEEDSESVYRRSSYPAEDEHDIEKFFRKNVPIYDGVPIARKGRYKNHDSRRYHYSRDEDEEEDKPMTGLLEVHDDHDSEYEYVPMRTDEFGKQKVMESDSEDDYEPPRYSYPSKYSSSYSEDDHFQNIFNKPSSDHPYRFESSYSPFKSHEDHSHLFSSNPPKYGTSHQYNSLADDQPRYYKHFTPLIRNQASDDDDRPSYAFPSTNHYREQPRSPHFHSHDFIPKRAGPFQPSFNKLTQRPTHVPQTLEEYHRIHGNFDTYKNKPSDGYNTYSSVIIPQDDKEDEEEEKEESPFQGPKSFVSLSFGSGLPADDDEVSIRHQVGHFKPKYSFLGGKSNLEDEGNVEYPSESIRENSGFNEPDSDSIKSYVDSFFKKDPNNNYSPSKINQPISPYNPHFGERVKQKATPSQNILWHRQASNDRGSPRTRSTREKNDRHLHEENIRLFDNLVKEFKPSKRDVDEKEKKHEEDEEGEENDPSEAVIKSKDDNDDDKPHHTYWSETISEPNK